MVSSLSKSLNSIINLWERFHNPLAPVFLPSVLPWNFVCCSYHLTPVILIICACLFCMACAHRSSSFTIDRPKCSHQLTVCSTLCHKDLTVIYPWHGNLYHAKILAWSYQRLYFSREVVLPIMLVFSIKYTKSTIDNSLCKFINSQI